MNKTDNKTAGYDRQFLQSRNLKERQCVYISRDVQEMVAHVVHVIGQRGLTIGAFIDSVLINHLQDHEDEINKLYSKATRKMFK